MIRTNVMKINTDVIKQAQQGDMAVITALYEHYHQSIYRYLYYRVGDQQTAEDLTSEVFLRMLRFIAGFHPPGATFEAWLFQIARNLAIDHYRRSGIRQHVPLQDDLAAEAGLFEKNIEHRLTSETLQQALETLSDDQRDVILMRFVAEMPVAFVAKTLHKSEDAIKGLQRRALAALRKTLSSWEVDYE